ncbi:MAG: DUF2786 domain-containing protein [Actinomycetota bacterium]|nr:DUF2786 domain-containing protein [Actinomycetota bacterium]
MSIERISALLAKAERTDNEHEAEAYLMKAQALATAASISLALAQAHVVKRQERTQPQSRTVTIGEKGKRANQHLISLFIATALANDVKVDIASNSTFVIAYGMPSDLEVVEALFTSLAVQMINAGHRWVSQDSWRGDTYVSITRVRGRSVRKVRAHTAHTVRVAFYRAYIERITERLQQVRTEVLRVEHVESSGTAMVLRDKESEITSFHKETSQARGSWQGYSGQMRGDLGTATKAGRRAADAARLSKQAELGQKSMLTG